MIPFYYFANIFSLFFEYLGSLMFELFGLAFLAACPFLIRKIVGFWR